MRYIDADKLILHLNDYKLQVSPSWKDEWERMVSCLVIDTCMDAVKEQPTADVRENVRGEWIHDEITRNGNTVYTPNAKCSICDCYVFQESNFCPNCGAEMKGDNNAKI